MDSPGHFSVTARIIPHAGDAHPMEHANDNLSRITKRIAKRQSIGDGWDGKPDTESMGWPLAKALLAEGSHDLLKYAMRYRQIELSANNEAVLGGTNSPVDMLQIDQRTWIKPNGEVAYTGVRKLTSAQCIGDIPAAQKTRTSDQTMRAAAPVPKKWNGDAKVIDHIDDCRRLELLRAALGPLVEPFEAAVVYGETLESVGRSIGAGSLRGAQITGKAVVVMCLGIVKGVMGEINRMDIAA